MSSQRRMPFWRFAFAAAALFVATVALFQLQSAWKPRQKETASVENSTFLTADTLREVQRAEAAYKRSIEKLSSIADPMLDRSASPLAAAYREKLLLIDSAIEDLKANIDNNPYNVYLQTQLATMYREKQSTLEAWLKDAKNN